MPSAHSDGPSGVEDIYKDPGRLTDSLSQYMSMRYRERGAFLHGLKMAEKALVHSELQRIHIFRSSIEDRKLSLSDKEPLVLLLRNARKSWNEKAYRDCCTELSKPDSLHTTQSNIKESKTGKSNTKKWTSEQKRRNRLIMRQVKERKGMVEDEPQTQSCSWRVEPEKKSGRYDGDYGFNGWHLSLRSGEGGNGDSQHNGVFQKMSINELLRGKDSPLKREGDTLRYIHFPANNMEWVEQAISRYYGTKRTDVGSHGVLNARSKTQVPLKDEPWRGQQRDGLDLPAHARQIGARCAVAPCAPEGGLASKGGPVPKGGPAGIDVALFMPYLHWEVEKRVSRMSDIVQKQIMSNQPEGEVCRQLMRRRTKLKELANNDRIHLKRPPPSSNRKADEWRPTSALAKYMWFAAKLFEVIDEIADEYLVKKYINSKPPIHIRRTLDQYYHWTMADTEDQDHNQVVYRKTRSVIDPRATSRLVMVDQLWMWILDQKTILTCFPRRWGRNKIDPSAVHRGVRQSIERLHKRDTWNIHELALIIIDECSRVFFDRTAPLDQRPEVVAIFGSAISDIAVKKTMAYEAFGKAVKAVNKEDWSNSDHEDLLRKSLNIEFKWSVLTEAQRLIDELQIMQEVFTQQLDVVRDLGAAIHDKCNAGFGNDADCGNSACRRAKDLTKDINMRKEELAGLDKLATKIRQQLRDLLDIKQQQAGIIEAKAAIKRADLSVIQGRSIIVFTVFTIIFLPLSFFASIFGMNSAELSSGRISLATQLTYMFSLSGALILISLSIAFSALVRAVISVSSRLLLSYWTHWTGLHDFVTKTIKKMRDFETDKKRELKKKHLKKQFSGVNQSEKNGSSGDGSGSESNASKKKASGSLTLNGEQV